MINYLESAIKQFAYYKMLGEKTFAQLDDASLFRVHAPGGNSIAVIVQHLHGNMLSRWTDFLTSDGEKTWRKRDAEFEAGVNSRAEVERLWAEGWNCLFSALDGLKADDLSRTVYIRNQGHTVTDAINRQLCHYAYHVGQIVLIGKMEKGGDWTSLSIPRNKSGDYNRDKFAQEKSMRHFTDEYIDKRESKK